MKRPTTGWWIAFVVLPLVSCASDNGSTATHETAVVVAPSTDLPVPVTVPLVTSAATTTGVAPVESSLIEVGAQRAAIEPEVVHLAWLPVLYPIFQFLPDGALLAAEPNTGRAVIVGADGSIRFDATLPKMQALVAGPDSVLYSAEPTAAGDVTLVAYATTGPDVGAEIARWETSWSCGTGTCAGLHLGSTGIAAGSTSAAIVAYVDESGRPSGATWSELDEPTITSDRRKEDGAQTMSTTDTVTLGDKSWSVHASKISSVVPTTYTAQRDGTVTAVFTGGGANQFERLVWLHRDGSATQFNTDQIGVAAFPNAIVDGGVLAIRFQDDSAELIRLDLPVG